MEIIVCDRCGRKTKNGPAFIPQDKAGNYRIENYYFGKPVILCNNCLIDFEDFRLNHESFNRYLTEEDNFEGKERCQIKF